MFLQIDLLPASSKSALQCQQFGSQYRPGKKDSPQESQSILERFTSANKKIAEVYQKVSYGIHPAKIIQSPACGKFM
jgi:hypothetical protein